MVVNSVPLGVRRSVGHTCATLRELLLERGSSPLRACKDMHVHMNGVPVGFTLHCIAGSERAVKSFAALAGVGAVRLRTQHLSSRAQLGGFKRCTQSPLSTTATSTKKHTGRHHDKSRAEAGSHSHCTCLASSARCFFSSSMASACLCRRLRPNTLVITSFSTGRTQSRWYSRACRQLSPVDGRCRVLGRLA